MPTQRAKRVTTVAPVAKYLMQSPGVEVHMDTMTKDLGLSSERISSALSYLRVKKGWTIETIVAGRIYIYKHTQGDAPNGKTRALYEHVGQTREGDIIAQGEDGTLYRMMAL